MDQNMVFVNEKKIERTIKALEKNGMNGYYIKSRSELLDTIGGFISEDAVVGIGGSMSLFETGVIDYLRAGKYQLLDRYEEGLTPEDIKNIYRASFSADVYLTSTNALTEDGILYNVDGNGNRVAAMIYGPDRVIVVCGVNKIVKDLGEAIKRNETIAAPANTQRLGMKTPCVITGQCEHCNSPSKICRSYTAITSQRDTDRIHVLILGEQIGY